MKEFWGKSFLRRHHQSAHCPLLRTCRSTNISISAFNIGNSQHHLIEACWLCILCCARQRWSNRKGQQVFPDWLWGGTFPMMTPSLQSYMRWMTYNISISIQYYFIWIKLHIGCDSFADSWSLGRSTAIEVSPLHGPRMVESVKRWNLSSSHTYLSNWSMSTWLQQSQSLRLCKWYSTRSIPNLDDLVWLNRGGTWPVASLAGWSSRSLALLKRASILEAKSTGVNCRILTTRCPI